MHDTTFGISSCKYCQCDIEGHQTRSSPQIHCLYRIDATDVERSTGITSDRPPAISWPFHMHPATCPLSPQRCQRKTTSPSQTWRMMLSCIVSWVFILPSTQKYNFLERAAPLCYTGRYVDNPYPSAASLGVVDLQDISCNCSYGVFQNKSHSLCSLVAGRSEMSESNVLKETKNFKSSHVAERSPHLQKNPLWTGVSLRLWATDIPPGQNSVAPQPPANPFQWSGAHGCPLAKLQRMPKPPPSESTKMEQWTSTIHHACLFSIHNSPQSSLILTY